MCFKGAKLIRPWKISLRRRVKECRVHKVEGRSKRLRGRSQRTLYCCSITVTRAGTSYNELEEGLMGRRGVREEEFD